MRRTKAGFSIDVEIDSDLEVLAFVTGETKSKIVEDGVRARRESLSGREREAFEAARSARAAG